MGFVEVLLPPTPVDVTRLGDAVLRLNEHFREIGDPARLRYASASWDEEPAMFVLLQLTLEMPARDDPDNPLGRKWETHERYKKLLNDYFSDIRGVMATVRLRTAEELAESTTGLGVPVPESVEAG
ncbi:MAG: hypothetical protein OXG47_06695 [bacterium]|nr:hypothetical protein [bacterium]